MKVKSNFRIWNWKRATYLKLICIRIWTWKNTWFGCTQFAGYNICIILRLSIPQIEVFSINYLNSLLSLFKIGFAVCSSCTDVFMLPLDKCRSMSLSTVLCTSSTVFVLFLRLIPGCLAAFVVGFFACAALILLSPYWNYW